MTPSLFWIAGPWRGRLAIVARPRGGDWIDDEARGWRHAGVDAVVSLLEPDEAEELGLVEEPGVAAANGVRFISFPIPDRGVPSSISQTSQLVQAIESLLLEGKNVAVHCRQSIGRSGLIAVAVLANSGVDVNEAIGRVSEARGLEVPETPEQLRWLEAASASRFAQTH